MDQQHGLTGNTNAAKQDNNKKLSSIHIRCDARMKAGAVKTAQDSGKTFSEWLIDLIKSNSKY